MTNVNPGPSTAGVTNWVPVQYDPIGQVCYAQGVPVSLGTGNLSFTPEVSTGALTISPVIEYLQRISAAYTLTSQTAAQKLLNATTNGALTLGIGQYEFECAFSLTSMSASSGSFGFALGGAATFTQAWWSQAAQAALATASTAQGTYNTAANTALVTAGTTTTGWAYIEGLVNVTVAGTIIPQVSLTVAAAAVVGVNSFFRIRSMGAQTVTNVGPWT